MPHGFSASVTFYGDETAKDPLLDWFLGRTLVEADSTLVPIERDANSEARVQLHALVESRSLVEQAQLDLHGAPVLRREYTVELRDPAALLWRQHFPLELRAQAKMKELIAAHLPNGMKLEMTLDDVERTRPMICVATDERTSFYDFVLDYAARAGGTFFYDYGAGGYGLAAARASKTTRRRLGRLDVSTLRIDVPASPLHGARVLNAYTEAAHASTVDAPPEALAALTRDRLVRTPSGADVDAARQLEAQRIQPAQPELHLTLARLPDVALMPGAQAGLDSAQHSSGLWPSGKTFRVSSLSLAADAVEGAQGNSNDGASRAFAVTMTTRWESENDGRARLPAHAAAGPLVVEGKIVADGGGEHDRIFAASADADSGLSYYVVHVPLWNQDVLLPFQPQFLPGHFFAPAYKNSRVLLALYVDRAEILQFLDWGPDVQLPAESQGNQLLFGKNATSQTSLSHAYVDEKAVFALARTEHADHGRMQLEDGMVWLEVKEDANAATEDTTADLTPQVGQAQSTVTSGSNEALGKVEAATSQGSAKLDGNIAGARANLTGSLDSLGGELDGKTAAGSGQLQTSVDGVGARLPALESQCEAALNELQAKRGAT